MTYLPSLISAGTLLDLAAVAGSTPSGCFVEVGVYRGGSAAFLYQVAEAQGRTLHLFDTFAGHTVIDPAHDNVACHYMGRFAENADSLADLRRAMPHAVFHVGTFPDTLGEDPPTPTQGIAFVHADVDVYWPTRAICEILPARMVPGGVIWFDDYPYLEGCPGVVEAVNEAFGPPPDEAGLIRAGGHRIVRIPGPIETEVAP
jgi:hypothetical protein